MGETPLKLGTLPQSQGSIVGQTGSLLDDSIQSVGNTYYDIIIAFNTMTKLL